MRNFFDFLKKLPKDQLPKDKIPFFIGGIVAGILGLLVIIKITTPWVKKACVSILEQGAKGLGREERIVSIEAAQVKLGTMTKRISTVGKLRANNEVVIRSEMAGKIQNIHFQEGSDVHAGDVLIDFVKDDLEAELKQAQAELVLRKADYERQKQLKSTSAVSEKKYEEAKAAFDMAEAKVEAAEAKLKKATIVAPFSGTIGLIDVSIGAFVQGAQDLVRLVENDPMKIDFKVPEKNLHDVGVGQSAELKLEGFPDEKFVATIDAIDARVDPQSHSIAIRASIPNSDKKLRAGLFASVSVIIGEKGNTIMVPESAVAREGNVEYVWTVESGKAGRRPVLTGTRENGQIEIVAGLRPGEIVVTSGQIKLGEGTAVKITNMPETGGHEGEVPAKTPSEEASMEKAPSEQSKAEDKTSSTQQETPAHEKPEADAANAPVAPPSTEQKATDSQPVSQEPKSQE
jgi:membrane fusion protein (multidrug efflux system)